MPELRSADLSSANLPSVELISPEAREFASGNILATLSTIGPDGSIHVVAVGFTLVGNTARVITSGPTQKVRNIERDSRATLSQLEGRRWLTLSGKAHIERDAESVAEAVRLYSGQYRIPTENPQRVAIVIEIDSVLGSPGMRP